VKARASVLEDLGAAQSRLEHCVTRVRRQLAKIRQVWAAVAHHQGCYPALPVPAEQAIHHGPIGKIKDVVATYAAFGLDLLVLMPGVRSVQQLELLSEQVLSEYQH
jgi:hypothetical protein